MVVSQHVLDGNLFDGGRIVKPDRTDMGLKSKAVHRILVSPEPLNGRVGLIMGISQEINMPGTGPVHGPGRVHHSLVVIGRHDWDVGRQLAVKRNDWQARSLVFTNAKVMGTGDYAIHLVGNQHAQVGALLFLIRYTVTQDHFVVIAQQFVFNFLDQLGEKRVRNRRNDDAN